MHLFYLLTGGGDSVLKRVIKNWELHTHASHMEHLKVYFSGSVQNTTSSLASMPSVFSPLLGNPERQVYVTGHGGLYLVLAKWDSRVFEYLFCNFLLTSSNVLSDCICSLPEVSANSAEQQIRLARFFFNKMTNILRQCTF